MITSHKLRATMVATLAVFCTLVGMPTTTTFAQKAYVMDLEADWVIDGDLPTNAMLISLQGIANKNGPALYFRYPDDWAFKFTRPVFDYYQTTRGISFSELSTSQDAIAALAGFAKGYIVWDTAVRTSLTVAFTVAGLEDAIVVTEALIPLMEENGLQLLEDFRGDFQGQTDAEIYAWAIDEYWDRCSRDFIIWMGGVANQQMQPGVADFGIYKKAFFTDLSADPDDTVEYALHRKLIGDMKSTAIVMGWHSYAKDTEGQHVSLLSSYGLRMEGLNTLPNASFSNQIPTSPGFRFRNNHNVEPNEVVVPEDKVYIAAIQTDALGIGAWEEAGRGRIPYAWEVTMNWTWLFPAQMQFFYETATPNDYFIGALSGPGYMYPKPIPPAKHKALVKEAEGLMKDLDMRVFEVMDYSEGNRYFGNIDLTKGVIDRYYEGMPDAIGFINGYGPAHTNDLRNGVPLLSYDYYLTPTRPEDDAVLDMKELISMNPVRPYFLLVHVRESSAIDRVANMFDRLGDEVEVVPLDVFLKMASNKPTFIKRHLKEAGVSEFEMLDHR